MSDDGATAVVGAPVYDISVGSAAAWFRVNRSPSTGVWALGDGYASPGPIPNTYPQGVASTMLGNSMAMSADARVVVAGAPFRADASGVDVGAAEVWACGA